MFAAVKKKFGFDYIIEEIRSRVYNKTNLIKLFGEENSKTLTKVSFYFIF
jgi:hypothetical protein